jgi:glutathione S-transferase
VQLFYSPGACSLSPHIVLREIGQDFTLEKVDLTKKKTESGKDYLTINPKGQVPALLLDDGSLLTEGVAIVLYLADKVPNCNLIAAAGNLRAP